VTDVYYQRATTSSYRTLRWSRRLRRALLTLGGGLLLLFLFPQLANAEDENKSGVQPQVISLPSGPGSLEGLGASFEPNLNTGTAGYPVEFVLPPGVNGFQPDLRIVYNGGNPNGPWGIGWKLDLPHIARHTDEGLPSYDDQQDRFIYSDGEKLTALANGDYRFENEGQFMRFRRLPRGGWEAHMKDGTRYLFGETEQARETNARGTFCWKLERQIDTHGNEIHYTYFNDGGYAYLRSIRYNETADGRAHTVLFSYQHRADVFVDRRSRAPIAMGLRAAQIQVWGIDRFVRAYQFDYATDAATGRHSLLQRITQIGDDGVSTLPATTFAYTRFDPASHQVVSMQSPPPLSLTNPDADLVDINADSLPDIVYTPSSGHRYYINRGNGRWQAEPVFPIQSPPDRLSSPNAQMADMNGDGQTDLLIKAGITQGSPFYYYAGATGRAWEQADRVAYDRTPTWSLDNPNLQLVDMNNDKRIDVLLATGERYLLFLARADNTWPATADVSVSAPSVGGALRFELPQVKLADMSGDRIQDVVFVRNGLVVYFPHNGLGDYAEPVTMRNAPANIRDQEANIQLGDLNNDGLADLVLPAHRSVRYWLNLGDGSFAAPVTLGNTPAYDVQDTAVRLADIDGDGASELLFSRYPAGESEAYQYVDFATGVQPFLLSRIDNGYGRSIHIDYQPSTGFYVADWDAGEPWATALPFPMQIVNRVTIHDANSGDAYITDYRYRDGYYDGEQKEFRGFVRSAMIQRGDETAATTITRETFDVGEADESRKGLLLAREVLREGGTCSARFAGCFLRQTNSITTRLLARNDAGQQVAYSFVQTSDTFVHEQQASPVHLRQTFDHDDYGNRTEAFHYGRVCGDDPRCGDDEVVEYTTYARNLDAWILDRPAQVDVTDADGNFVSATRLYYDGADYVGLPLGQVNRGDLSRQEESLGPLGNDRFIPTRRQSFDQYGNVVGIQDANGNRTTVVYDALLHTFPVLERIHLDENRSLAYAASYDHDLGTLTAATDFNVNVSTFHYDTHARLAAIVLPGDTQELPTQAFRYDLGSPRSSITTEQREQSGTANVYTSVTYFDGLGRKLQTRADAENGQVTVTEASTFNARASVGHTYLPYFSTGLAYTPPDPALPHTANTYDARSRVVRVTNPDGSFSTVEHQPLMQLQYDEEDNREGSPHANTPRTLLYDGLERLVGVDELNWVDGTLERYETRYSYDLQNNLTRLVDAQGNMKTMLYDGLSRKLRMDDPNRGLMTYTYDDNGNLLETRDAKGQIVRYRYDAANRVLSEDWLRPDTSPERAFSYFYDEYVAPAHPDATNTLGRLAYVVDQEGAAYFSYDARGNIAGRIRSFDAEALSFVTRMGYDSMDRLTELTYPDGAMVNYVYNDRSLLEAVPGFVDNIDYTASGQRATASYANNATTSYDYDERLRLEQLRTGVGPRVIQDLSYTFDTSSNITAIVDGRPTRTTENDQSQTYGYDSLYRLTSASGTYGQINYAYDGVGNMIQKTSTAADARLNLGAMSYGAGDAGPYALTSAGGATYTYDPNGNRTGNGTAVYRWNPRDWLESVTEGETVSTYGYDNAGQRVRQTVASGGAEVTTLYLGKHAEVRGDTLVRYVFDDQQRIVRESVPFDPAQLIQGFSGTASDQAPSGERNWYIADHLGGTSLLLDGGGSVSSEVVYYPYGLTRYEQNGGAARYRFTGKELDASGLYYFEARYYDALTGRFVSVDPLFTNNPLQVIEQPRSLNLYSYTLGNPVKYIDPDGQDAIVAYGTDPDPEAAEYFKATAQKIYDSIIAKGGRAHMVPLFETNDNNQVVPSLKELNRVRGKIRRSGHSVDAAIYSGHGDIAGGDGYLLPAASGQISVADLATNANVRKGGLVAILGCNTVSGGTTFIGPTYSEKDLARENKITTVGFYSNISSVDGNIKVLSSTSGQSRKFYHPMKINPTHGMYGDGTIPKKFPTLGTLINRHMR
jgi:RHS repeat-associated protein